MPSKYDNSGALFKNDKTGGNPNWPDYKGSITVEGKDYWLSAWLKEGKDGKKFMSLSVKPKEKTSGAKQTTQRDTGEIPF